MGDQGGEADKIERKKDEKRKRSELGRREGRRKGGRGGGTEGRRMVQIRHSQRR